MNRFYPADANLPNWRPLVLRVPTSECTDFMWMHRDGAVEFYKHIITRRYLMLNGEGNCLRWSGGELQVVDFEPEYLRVTGME